MLVVSPGASGLIPSGIFGRDPIFHFLFQSHDVPTPGAEASPAESTSTSASSTSSSATAAAAARRPSTGSGSNRSSKPAKSGKANNNKRFKSES